MSKIALAGTFAVMLSLAVAADCAPERVSARHNVARPRVAGKAPGWGVLAESPAQATLPARDPNREPAPQVVVWIPDPQAPNPFGFIPTTWTVQPRLLPLTWDVQTVPATGTGPRLVAGRPGD